MWGRWVYRIDMYAPTYTLGDINCKVMGEVSNFAYRSGFVRSQRNVALVYANCAYCTQTLRKGTLRTVEVNAKCRL